MNSVPRVEISFAGESTVVVELRPDVTQTLKALLAALPFGSKANMWGEEVYFDVPFHADLERDARADMELGEVAFWPDGDALAVFFGRTPASTGPKPRAYSPCNIVGRVTGDLSVLKSVRSGDPIEVRALRHPSLARIATID